MKAYIFQAALYCEACAKKIMADTPKPAGYDPNNESSFDSDHYPKGPFPDGGGEADSPQHCDCCNLFLENPLTADGVAYVMDSVLDYVDNGNGSRAVLAQWARFYRDEISEVSRRPVIDARAVIAQASPVEKILCQRCGSPIKSNRRCSDNTCPFSDYPQNDPRGWCGHPKLDPD